jgi:hypothetical protein
MQSADLNLMSIDCECQRNEIKAYRAPPLQLLPPPTNLNLIGSPGGEVPLARVLVHPAVAGPDLHAVEPLEHVVVRLERKVFFRTEFAPEDKLWPSDWEPLWLSGKVVKMRK